MRRILSWSIAFVLTTTLPSLSIAQALGNHTEATSCAIAISGNVSNSSVSAVCALPPEILESLVHDE